MTKITFGYAWEKQEAKRVEPLERLREEYEFERLMQQTISLTKVSTVPTDTINWVRVGSGDIYRFNIDYSAYRELLDQHRRKSL